MPNPCYLIILFNLDTNLGPDTTPDSHSLANFIIFTAALDMSDFDSMKLCEHGIIIKVVKKAAGRRDIEAISEVHSR